jgi:hypothetical protein
MKENKEQKHKYIERGAKAGDALGWLGIWLPLPLFILVTVILAGAGAVIGFFAYLVKGRGKNER